MKRVMLVCNAGMSTGIMAKKIMEASKGTMEVFACGEGDLENHLDGVDMILVGPQIRFLVDDIKDKVDCPVQAIASQHYGVMNGAAVYQEIVKVLGA